MVRPALERHLDVADPLLQLPLALLHAAQAKPMVSPLPFSIPAPVPLTLPAQLVELKNGETFNGHLVGCDNFMNLTLKEVYQTSAVRHPPMPPRSNDRPEVLTRLCCI